MANKKVIWIYPILFGVYPVITLLAKNIAHINPTDALRSLFLSFMCSIGAYIFIWFLTRDWGIAAIVCVILEAFFFSYGHVYEAIEGAQLAGFIIGRHMVLAPIFAIGLAISLFAVRKILPDRKAHRILLLISIVLLSMPVIEGTRGWMVMRQRMSSTDVVVQDVRTDNNPDIYLVILDSYSREDVLEEVYDFDNREFLDQLTALGFVVSDCGMSNYSWTPLSLGSMLMMDYMYNIDGKVQEGTTHLNFMSYHSMIAHSTVRNLLTEKGYKTVAFDTGHAFTTITDAEVFITAKKNPLASLEPGYGSNEFDELFIRTTAARVVLELFDGKIKQLLKEDNSSAKKHYERILFDLNILESVHQLDGPKFVFAHISAPHAPWVFLPDGSYAYSQDVMTGYPSEVQYLNTRIIKILESIIKGSSTPPIIILMGDHGQPMERRNDILYAVYSPAGLSELPYQTPINTFRWLFSEFFQMKYPLLDEHSYLSKYDTPLELVEIPLTCVD